MQLFKPRSFFAERPPSEHPEGGAYARLITDNLGYIEKQCRRAVLQSMTGAGGDGFTAGSDDGLDLENQSDELLNEVLDRLREDDFKALREFKGKAKLTTYLTTIVANLVIDLVRQKKGRSRARERARELGEVAERLYELVYHRGCTLSQAHSHLEVDHGIREPLEALQGMLEKIRGRGARSQMLLASDPEEVWLVPGTRVAVDDEVEFVVPDPRKDAEAVLIETQRESGARQAVQDLLAGLDGEERFLLRLRFPTDGSTPMSFKEIGKLVGATENGVDARIRRILVRFRESLLRRGLTLKDLV
ncbi:hypothetical protein GEOBRER4_n2669 [Citrifermentans bremense]|uniref:Uncharacterized protein n=1 Tax=Citrifermentans bremense TaxID=60035 RepID=A0A6S6M2K9_9BACT|nr:sigma-70 family RNA polymerase sigma factor [Citrifermentans bremense]BCG47820.1 hypothetical protein GEOBRER4_n2669 [Citrifermentans bremense]